MVQETRYTLHRSTVPLTPSQLENPLTEAWTMAVYEVVLRFPDRDEFRLTDRPLKVGGTVAINGGDWLVESEESHNGHVAVRFVCVELQERSRELRARSSKLIGRLEELRERGP